MRKLVSFIAAISSLSLALALVLGSVACSMASEPTLEQATSIPRAAYSGDEGEEDDDDGGGGEDVDTPETDDDGFETPETDNDGVIPTYGPYTPDTPTPVTPDPTTPTPDTPTPATPDPTTPTPDTPTPVTPDPTTPTPDTPTPATPPSGDVYSDDNDDDSDNAADR